MKNQNLETRPQGDDRGRKYIKTTFTERNNNIPSNQRKYPPYARELRNKPPKKSVVVITGSGGWNVAKEPNSISNQPKLLLPHGEDPTLFMWPVSARDCMIILYGQPENHETILKLTHCLLTGGAMFVVWGMKSYPMTRIDCRRAAA